MIITSEITGKTYKSVEDCLSDEKRYKKEKEERERAQKKHEQEIEDAYRVARNAYQHFMEVADISEDDARALELQMIVDLL